MTRASRHKQVHDVPGEQLSFFEPSPFGATWPKRNTLSDKALKMLLDGKMFDHPDFLGKCASWRLSSVIFDLRTLGWPVETVNIPSPSAENPGRSVGFYKLNKKFIGLVSAATAGGAA